RALDRRYNALVELTLFRSRLRRMLVLVCQHCPVRERPDPEKTFQARRDLLTISSLPVVLEATFRFPSPAPFTIKHFQPSAVVRHASIPFGEPPLPPRAPFALGQRI